MSTLEDSKLYSYMSMKEKEQVGLLQKYTKETERVTSLLCRVINRIGETNNTRWDPLICDIRDYLCEHNAYPTPGGLL